MDVSEEVSGSDHRYIDFESSKLDYVDSEPPEKHTGNPTTQT